MFHFGRKINIALFVASSLVITIGVSSESSASETANALLGKMLVSNTDIAKPVESSPNAAPVMPTPAGASSLASVLSPTASATGKPADAAPQTTSPVTTTTVANVPAEATMTVKPADIASQTVSPTTTPNAMVPAVLSPSEAVSIPAVKSDAAQAAMPAATPTTPTVPVPVGATSKKQDGLVSEGGTVLLNDKGFPGMKDGEWFMYVADVEEFKKKLDSDEKQQGSQNQAGVDGDGLQNQSAQQLGQQLPFGPTPAQNQMPFGPGMQGQNGGQSQSMGGAFGQNMPLNSNMQNGQQMQFGSGMQNQNGQRFNGMGQNGQQMPFGPGMQGQNGGQSQSMGGAFGQNMPLNSNMQNGQQMPFGSGMQNQNGQRSNGMGQNGQQMQFGPASQNSTDQGFQNLPMLTLLVNGNGKTVKYECSAK